MFGVAGLALIDARNLYFFLNDFPGILPHESTSAIGEHNCLRKRARTCPE
jgi:hypothetical protein